MDKIEYEITQYGLFDSTVKFPDCSIALKLNSIHPTVQAPHI